MGVIVVTGIPGVGKTTVMKKAVEGMDRNIVTFGTVMMEIAKELNLVNKRDEMRKLTLKQQKNLQIKTAERIAKLMLNNQIELLVFCGGDGTARDIFDAIRLKVPVVGIPSGVKMFSSVFALNPKAAAKIVDHFIEGTTDTQENEVLDIDEGAFRDNRLVSKLYGYLGVPKIQNLIQNAKDSSKVGRSIDENKYEIAQQIIETMEEDTLYLLGPGTTVKSITDQLNLGKSLLGVDAIYNQSLVGEDLNESSIIDLLDKYQNGKIIVSPIGGQGFVFGRGNIQFTPKILKRLGKKNIIIIGTEEKIKSLKFAILKNCVKF